MKIKYEYPAQEHVFSGKRGEKKLWVRSIGDADLEAVLDLQTYVKANMPNPDFLGIAPREEIAESIYEDLCVGVFDGDRVVAFCILIANRESQYNLGQKFGFPPEECVSFDIVFVHPDYRGLGLQRFLLGLRKSYGRKMGAKRGFATVAPENAFSLNNILNSGFAIYDRVKMYGGLDRYLMMEEYGDAEK